MESRVTLYKGMYWLRDDGDGVNEEHAAVNSSCHELLTVFPDVPKKIAEFVSFKGVVVQAGGNNGLYAKQYAELFDTVYTFEPIPELFYCLNRNLTSDNVFKFQACLGNTHGLVGLGRKLNNNGGSSNICGGGNTPTMRIDDLGLSRCDLIHLDIEGFEMFALDGGRITIERCKPVIVLEESGHHCMRFGVDPRQIVSWLESFGYTQIGEVQGDRVYKTRQVG